MEITDQQTENKILFEGDLTIDQDLSMIPPFNVYDIKWEPVEPLYF